jgi:DNA-binding SARP family transcriptional activator
MVRVSLMGALAVETDGLRLDERQLGGRHARVAFALLVYERARAVPRDEIAEALWPGDRLPLSWDSALRGAMSRVRTFLAAAGLDPTAALTSAFGCYRLLLPDGAEVDVEVARGLVSAAESALAAGDAPAAGAAATRAAAILSARFLPGIDSPWADARRRELTTTLVRALELASEAHTRAGAPTEGLAAAERALALEPFRESVHRRLMLAHAATGNRAEALRAYERCRRLLAEELGVDPAPETVALYVQLLTDDAGQPDETRLTVVPSPRQRRPPVAEGPTFVGRTAELARIEQAWRDATAGGRRLVVVAGENGIGKTRLAWQAAAATGGTVLYGRCDPDLGLPYQPFSEALRAWVGSAGGLAGRLGPLAAELARLAPGLGGALTAEAAAGLVRPPGGTAAPAALFDAVAAWLDEAGRSGPVALVLDDLHWADRPTLALLRHLLRSETPARLLVIATYCSADVGRGHPLGELLAALRDLPGVVRIALGGLEADDVARLAGLAPGTPLARFVWEHTGGNPFFVCELVRHLGEVGALTEDGEVAVATPGVPDRVRDLVGARLGRLPAGVVRVLEAAAVVGREFDAGVLADVAGVPEGRVLDALERARSAGLVREVDGADRMAFAHGLVQSVLADEVAAPRRLRLHLRAARSLAARPDAHARVGEIAHHFCEAAPLGEADTARRAARAAGDAAAAALSLEQAASWYERALALGDLPPPAAPAERCDLMLALGSVLHRAGDPRHREVLLRAAAAARDLGDPERLAGAGLALNMMGSPTSAGQADTDIVEILEDALAGLPAGDSELRARVAATLAVELLWSPDLARRRALAGEAIAMADRLGDAVAARVLYPALVAGAGPDNLDQRLSLAASLVTIGRRLGDHEAHCRGLMCRADVLVELGDRAGAEAALDAAERAVADLRHPYCAFEVTMRRAGLALLAGKLEEAEALIERTAALARARNVPASQLAAVQGSQLLVLRAEQGRMGELVDALGGLSALSPRFGPTILAYAAAETGRSAEARRHIGRAVANVLDGPRDIQWLAAGMLCAMTCARLTDAGTAHALYRALAPWAGRMTWVTAVSCGPTDYGLGLLAATAGDHERADAHLMAAATLCQRMDAPTWHARAVAARARARAGGRREPAERSG